MDTLSSYRATIKRLISEYAQLPYRYGDIRSQTVFDEQGDHYLLMHIGWQKDRRYHGALLHLDIIDGKIWIQRDGTEDGIATALLAAGIPADHIVLGFHPADVRPHTEFAVA